MAPDDLGYNWENNNQLNVYWTHPNNTNGVLNSFQIFIENISQKINYTIYSENDYKLNYSQLVSIEQLLYLYFFLFKEFFKYFSDTLPIEEEEYLILLIYFPDYRMVTLTIFLMEHLIFDFINEKRVGNFMFEYSSESQMEVTMKVI